MTGELEILTIGRISIDLYSPEIGAGWEETGSFTKALGGSPTNVAVAASRLGRRAAVITKVGDDPFGGVARAELLRYGVDDRFAGVEPGLPTPLAFAVLDPPEEPQLAFYRGDVAPDSQIHMADVDLELVRAVPLLWVSAGALSVDPTGATTEAMLVARERRVHTVLDLDYRPTFWPSREAATARIGAALDHVTVAVGNREECAVATGTGDPHEAAERLLARGVEVAIVKLGGDGVLVATADTEITVAPTPVEVVCGLGAGDAFGGALCHGLLSGWDLERSVTFANAAGALVASRLLCSEAMPYEHEVLGLIDHEVLR